MPELPPSYRLYPDQPDDFEARIRILTPEERGRKLPMYNGIRWNFQYAKDAHSTHYHPVYPDFYCPESGNSWRTEVPLPVNEWLLARMYCIDLASRVEIHQNLLQLGTRFYGCEGARIVAEGTVTRITGLFEERQ